MRKPFLYVCEQIYESLKYNGYKTTVIPFPFAIDIWLLTVDVVEKQDTRVLDKFVLCRFEMNNYGEIAEQIFHRWTM